MEAGAIRFHAQGVFEVDPAAEGLGGLPVGEFQEELRNWRTDTVASCAGESPGLPSHGWFGSATFQDDARFGSATCQGNASSTRRWTPLPRRPPGPPCSHRPRGVHSRTGRARWAQLTAHSVFGAAVQHLALDQAETQALADARLRAADPDADPAPALSEDLLFACPPALCGACPSWPTRR